MGVEPFRVLQTKDFRLESIAYPAQYLNFRTPIARDLAHTGAVPILFRGTKASNDAAEGHDCKVAHSRRTSPP